MSRSITFRSPQGTISLNLDTITGFQILHKRSHCELVAITPENPRTQNPYTIATRDSEWKIRDLMQELNQLKEETGDIIIEITDTGIRKTK